MSGQVLVDLDPLLDTCCRRCLLSLHIKAQGLKRLIVQHRGLLYSAIINPSPGEVPLPLNWRNDGLFRSCILFLINIVWIMKLWRNSLGLMCWQRAVTVSNVALIIVNRPCSLMTMRCLARPLLLLIYITIFLLETISQIRISIFNSTFQIQNESSLISLNCLGMVLLPEEFVHLLLDLIISFILRQVGKSALNVCLDCCQLWFGQLFVWALWVILIVVHLFLYVSIVDVSPSSAFGLLQELYCVFVWLHIVGQLFWLLQILN